MFIWKYLPLFGARSLLPCFAALNSALITAGRFLQGVSRLVLFQGCISRSWTAESIIYHRSVLPVDCNKNAHDLVPYSTCSTYVTIAIYFLFCFATTLTVVRLIPVTVNTLIFFCRGMWCAGWFMLSKLNCNTLSWKNVLFMSFFKHKHTFHISL